jgi:hypothetical protein
MLMAASHSVPIRAAWQRAVAARDTSAVLALTGADRLAVSSSRLERARQRLDESDRRVRRARERAKA